MTPPAGHQSTLHRQPAGPAVSVPLIQYLRWPAAVFMLICIWILPSHLKSQTWDFKRFHNSDGLTNSFIYTLAQDKPGFIWVGTGNGLFRFDGSKFRAFGKRDGLNDDFITASLADKEGKLWFGDNKGGITSWSEGKFSIHPISKQLKSTISGILQDDYGNIWVATQQDGLARINRQGESIVYKNLFPGNMIFTIGYLGKGKFLIGTDAGVIVIRIPGAGARPEISHTLTNVPATRIQNFRYSAFHRGILIATEDEGFYLYKPGKIPTADTVIAFNDKNGFPAEMLTNIGELPDGKIWLARNSGGPVVLAPDPAKGLAALQIEGMRDSLAKIQVKSFFNDRFGQLWMGTYGQGLVRISQQHFSFHKTPGTGNLHSLICLQKDHDGNYWAGTSEGLLSLGNQFTGGLPLFLLGGNVDMPQGKKLTAGLANLQVTALCEVPAGTLWIGTDGGGLHKMDIKTQRIVPVPISRQNLTSVINDLESDPQGFLWAGTRDGVFRINPADESYEYFTMQNGLPHNNVTDLYRDSKGQIWLASRSHKAAFFNGKEFITLGLSAENVLPEINCLTQDEQGNFWFGTDGAGVIRYDGREFITFTQEEGLLAEFCYHIEADNKGSIWVTHRAGISRIIPATGKILQYPSRELFPADETEVMQILPADKSHFWFVTTRGLLNFNRECEYNFAIPPQVFLTSFQVFEENKPLVTGTELPYEKYRIKFTFLGLSFVDQNEVKYQYKLDGNDIDWSDITSQDEVTYQGLAHGTYVFRVRACNKFGTWSTEEVAFTFTIAPPFWARWWFRIAVVVGAIALFYGLLRYRLYRLRKEKEFLEEKITERTAELQDEKQKVEKAYLEIQKLSLAVSETNNAIFILDNQGNLEWVNKGFSRMTGYTLPEFLEVWDGRSLLEASTNQKIKELLKSAVSQNKPISYESTLPTKTGGTLWVISTLTPILDKEGKLVNIVVIDSDISDRKRAEQEIQEMNQKLEQLVEERTGELAVANEQLQHENEEHIKTAAKLREINTELDTFIYRASHDLKGPLASLIGLVGLSRSEITDSGALRYIDLMERSATRLDSILIDLLEATTIRQAVPHNRQFLLRPVFNGILENIGQRLNTQGCQFVMEVDPALEMVNDQYLLLPALQNLVDNAVKYSDPNKTFNTVTIRAWKDGALTHITISDQGRGIPSHQAEKVFEMFFRGDTTSKGTGLGLYIVKNAIEKTGGEIKMESEPGVGSTFKLVVPDKPVSPGDHP